MIYNADSIEKLKELDENSIDSIVCDPPYFINFMGKKWDAKKHIAAHPDFWTECLRVLKPGGYALAFGHSRTHHRLFTAIEDAGFQIKDTIMWMYGSGFPKSHNISIALDKKLAGMKHRGVRSSVAGNIRDGQDVPHAKSMPKHEGISDEAKQWEGWGTALKPAYEPICLAQKPRVGTYADNVLKHGVGGLNIDETRVGSNEDFSHVKPRTMMTNTGSVAKTKREGGEHNHEAATSLQVAKEKLQNLGRFPANVILSHHEDCKQVGVIEEKVAKNVDFKDTKQTDDGFWEMNKCVVEKQTVVTPDYECVDGCPIKELDSQSGITKGSGKATITKAGIGAGLLAQYDGRKTMPTAQDIKLVRNVGDSGGASRFFYCAKSGKKERNKYMPEDAPLKSAETRTATGAGVYAEKGFNPPRRNHHPTIKPIKLMTYLIKLITPAGGTVLDPFMGSGSTGIAALEGGWKFVGIEKDKEYYEIAKARLDNLKEKL